MYGSVEYEECGVRSAENEECRKCGMMKMKKKVEISIIALKKNCPHYQQLIQNISHFYFTFPIPLLSNLDTVWKMRRL